MNETMIVNFMIDAKNNQNLMWIGKFVILPFLGYLGSIIISLILDKNIKKCRIDKTFLYLLFISKTYINLKLKMDITDKITLNEIKKKVENEFKYLDYNKLSSDFYEFKLKSMHKNVRVRIFEPEIESDSYSITLENIGEEQIGRFNNNSELYVLFEKFNKLFVKGKNDLLNAEIKFKIRKFIKNNDNVSITKQNMIIKSEVITLKIDSYSNIKNQIKEAIQEWSIKFL